MSNNGGTPLPKQIEGASYEQTMADGFAHLKQVIPPDQIEEFLKLAREHGDASNLHETPLFTALTERLQLHKVVQQLFKDPVYYMAWSTVMVDVKAQASGLHDDAKGSQVSKTIEPSELLRMQERAHRIDKHEQYPVWRLFIYLNDHKEHSGGTKVRRGSHRRSPIFSKEGFKALTKGRFNELMFPFLGYYNPPVQPGDAVLFNLRVKHAAHFLRLRGPFRNFALPAFLDNGIKSATLGSPGGRKFLNLIAYPFPEKRTSLIMDFCLDSDWARGFQLNRLVHPNNKKWRGQIFDCNRPEFVARLEQMGMPPLHNPSLKNVESFLNKEPVAQKS
ncbi:MAG: phytanoyl-CoA dioxygenase family protein [Verrucomicrobiota bacterium]